MLKRFRVFAASIAILIAGGVFGACDFGIYDAMEVYNPFENMAQLLKDALKDIDWNELLTEEDWQAIFESIDINKVFPPERVEELLDGVDWGKVLTKERLQEILSNIDIKELLSPEDLKELLKDVPLTELIPPEDLEKLLKDVDWTKVLTDKDVEELLKTVDLTEVLKDVDWSEVLTDEDIKKILKGKGIKELLDPIESYEQLLVDLKFMINGALFIDGKLASAQAYTIMTSYGQADMSKEQESYSVDARARKADLYARIRDINVFANAEPYGAIEIGEVALNTNLARADCEALLAYLKTGILPL